MNVAGVLMAACVFSGIMTGSVRRYAIRHGVLDVPNDRSSHATPTPRGGGVAIVAAFLLGLTTFALSGEIDTATATALGGAGVGVAIIGFLDDHLSIAAPLCQIDVRR